MSIHLKTTARTESIQTLIDRFTSQDNSCGLCELGKGDRFWPTYAGGRAHSRCVGQISPSVGSLRATIQSLFSEFQDRICAQMEAVQAVRKTCDPMTIISYLEVNGSENMTKLFNTIGVEAVKQLATDQQARKQLSEPKRAKL